MAILPAAQVPDTDDDLPDMMFTNDIATCSVAGCSNPRAEKTSRTGRAPTKCEEHKGKNSRTVSRELNSMPASDKLARNAAELLVSLNGMMTAGALVFGFTKTASALADEDATDKFRSQVYEALRTDPALCKAILKGGVMGGKMALIFAYTMYLTPVAVTAYGEVSDKREARRDETP